MPKKIVVNKRYGGFGLSNEALIEWCKRKDYAVCESKDFMWAYPHKKYDSLQYVIYKDELEGLINDGDIPRDDADLIAIVEEMEGLANGRFASLVITEIPDDVDWEIGEYDGMEWVQEKHRRW